MKLSNAALFAVLASATFASAAPTEQMDYGSSVIVTRQDANEVLDILAEIKSLKAKREFAEGDYAIELDKRADSLITTLINALANSGIISDIWNALTKDTALRSTLSSLIKSALQTAVVQGPALIESLWNSGLIQKLFNKLLNDTALRSSLLNIAKALFSSAANIVTSYGSSSTAAATTTAAAATKREDILPEDILDKRDLASLITTIVTEIKNTGIVQALVKKVLADPDKSIAFLTSALKQGVVIFDDVYSWAKSSGLLASSLNWLKNNTGTVGNIVKALGSFLALALTGGTVAASEIDGASSTAAAATVVQTTAATVTTAAATAYKRMLY